MHEVGLASSLIKMAAQEMTRRGYARCLALQVEIGELSGVSPEALAFAFETLSPDSAVAGARLCLVPVPALVRCGACGGEGPFPKESWHCLRCGGGPLEIVRGKEMDLKELEVE